MIVFYILVNICFPYHNVLIPIYTKTSGSISMFCFAIPISSPINLVCGLMSISCILDISSSGVGRASTFSCYWIHYGPFFSKPPPLRSCGILGCTSSSWVAPFMRSCDSLVCTSSSWAIPLGLTYISSCWPNTFVLVGLPQMKFGIFFW